MTHTRCKIKKDHYWGVGQTTKPTLTQLLKAGIKRRSAAQHLRRCHDAVLLLVGAVWEQVQIQLTPQEARHLAEYLLEKAEEVETRVDTADRHESPKH